MHLVLCGLPLTSRHHSWLLSKLGCQKKRRKNNHFTMKLAFSKNYKSINSKVRTSRNICRISKIDLYWWNGTQVIWTITIGDIPRRDSEEAQITAHFTRNMSDWNPVSKSKLFIVVDYKTGGSPFYRSYSSRYKAWKYNVWIGPQAKLIWLWTDSLPHWFWVILQI